jgi:hypothetical protein
MEPSADARYIRKPSIDMAFSIFAVEQQTKSKNKTLLSVETIYLYFPLQPS